ncbi:MAG: cobalamin-dependent protein [Clostridiales bacterium]|jgi:methanogenic corrinoid protein MtbC1|nr:cobalamin-dependent protein [Eubacteriales bacterium]MDH7566071.1 cobalamin-dependent protein [Clostridiales bacterium]
MIDFEKLKTAMGELDNSTVIELLEELMAAGGKGADEALAACQEGMNVVGDLFESGEYFVADLIFAGELMTQAMAIIKPAIAVGAGGNIGKMILCTVQGDLHDIGKNIVKAMLEAGGIEVIDLGIDVAPATIVQTARDQKIKVIGLSGVLTLAIDSMKATVDAFKGAGIRDDVKIIIGGAPVTAEYCKFVGADAWSLNAAKSVEICRNWLI